MGALLGFDPSEVGERFAPKHYTIAKGDPSSWSEKQILDFYSTMSASERAGAMAYVLGMRAEREDKP